MMSYAALFISALIAATLVPMQSEAVLVGLLIAGQKPIMWLVIVATVGNVLGAIINWYFGIFYTSIPRLSSVSCIRRTA